MSDVPTPPPPPPPPPANTGAASAAASPAPKPRNPALKMLGLPALPRKLPSRNWIIFWAVTGAFTAAIVHDTREKRRATARWRRAVEPLSRELVASPNALPRKLTVYLAAPPGDGLRVAQDHFIEYVKPVLAASGLDWDFVQGRQQGDVRAAVAEKIRRRRMADERPGEKVPPTDDSIVEDLRRRMGVREYEGVKGDVVIGRHAWKEYMR
ncbi:mitochondrial import inner membrane translocase subunit tim54, partial [Claviceps citrina]